MNFVQSHMIVDETALKGRYDNAMTMPVARCMKERALKTTLTWYTLMRFSSWG